MKSIFHLSILFSFLLSSLIINAQTTSQNCLNFDGSDDYVQTGYAGISGTSARTVEAWIKTTANSDPNNGGVQKVITDWGTMNTGSRFTFNLLWNNALRIEVGGSGLSSKTALNDGYWHHVAAVFDPSATNKYSLYVDGNLDTFGNIATTLNTAASSPLIIGKRNDNVNFFDGNIDEVRVWNYAKTASEIDSLKDEELCPNVSGLVAYYRFNQGTASGTNTSVTTLTSALSSSANGTLYNFSLGSSSSNWVSGAPISLAPNSDTTYSVSACGSYTSPGGQYTIFSKTIVDKLTNSLGCDSLVTIHVTIKSKSFVSEIVTACDSFTSTDGSTTWKNSGTFQKTYTNVNGCDSIHQTVLTINKTKTENLSISTCESYTSPSGKYTWTTSGNYADTLATNAGCDSILAINLTILNPTTSSLTPTECGSYTSPSGKTFTQSGLYIDTLTASNTCDSFVTINLVILEPTDSVFTISTCDSFTTESGTYTWKNSGKYMEILTNAAGCDSTIIYNLNLSYAKTASAPAFVNACNYFVNPYDNDTILTTSSREVVAKTAAGCDSTFTLNVTISSNKVTITQVGHKLTATKRGDLRYQWFDCDNYTTYTNDTTNVLVFWDNGPSNWGVATTSKVNTCTDTICITPYKPVSVSELDIAANLTIKPNPAKNWVELNTDLGTVSYRIVNQMGAIVMEGKFTQNTVIETSNLAAGVYTVWITKGSKSANKRLLIGY